MKGMNHSQLLDLSDWGADVSDLTDEEVLDELHAEGIDYKAALARFEEETLPRLRAARRRQRLHLVRERRLSHGEARDWLAHVRSLRLSIEELVERIQSYGATAVANRKLTDPAREDLEILLAELVALEADGNR